MECSTFKQGDLVKLNSGGPVMTVLDGSYENSIQCTFFEKGKLQEKSFPASMLSEHVSYMTPDEQEVESAIFSTVYSLDWVLEKIGSVAAIKVDVRNPSGLTEFQMKK